MSTENSTPRTNPTEKRRADRKPRTASPTQRLLTGTQIEQEWGIPYRSLYDLYVNKRLPAVRFVENGRLWFRREDVEALIASSVEQHT